MNGVGVLVAGGGVAGLRVAETLRARGYDRPVTVVGAEPVPPYERPALSKELLAGTRSIRKRKSGAIRIRSSAAWMPPSNPDCRWPFR